MGVLLASASYSLGMAEESRLRRWISFLFREINEMASYILRHHMAKWWIVKNSYQVFRGSLVTLGTLLSLGATAFILQSSITSVFGSNRDVQIRLIDQNSAWDDIGIIIIFLVLIIVIYVSFLASAVRFSYEMFDGDEEQGMIFIYLSSAALYISYTTGTVIGNIAFYIP